MEREKLMEAAKNRHSVRQYLEKEIDRETRSKLDAFVSAVNEESGLHIVVKYDDPEGFDSKLAKYGHFQGVSNYIVLKGADCKDFEERIGYFGEKIVIYAQAIGLNTCWAALTFNKKFVKKLVPADERFSMVIALGYGRNQGNPHKGKAFKDVVKGANAQAPEWFQAGVECALDAPTAVNQQKFTISLNGEGEDAQVEMKVSRFAGAYAKVDLGIVKYHFELASGKSCM